MASSAGSRALWLLVCALAMCQVVSAVTPTEVIANLQVITTLSSDHNDLVASINLVNVLFKGPQVAQGLNDITVKINEYSSSMGPPNNNIFKDKDAVAVVQVLKTFVVVHQRLLNTLIGKHGILSLFFFTEPVRVALVSLEAAVDTFALALIDLMPKSQAPAANDQFASLSITINAAINVYS